MFDFDSEFEKFNEFVSSFFSGHPELQPMLNHFTKTRRMKNRFVYDLFCHWQSNTFEWCVQHYLLKYEQDNPKQM